MEKSVYKGTIYHSVTRSTVSLRLLGEDGDSKRIQILGHLTILRGTETTFTLTCPNSIGKLVVVEIEKLKYPRDRWFVHKVVIQCPDDITYTFPIYKWIEDDDIHWFREGTAMNKADDHNLLAKRTREMELSTRKNIYSWHLYKEGLPHCFKADSVHTLPCEVRFSFTKEMQFDLSVAKGLAEIKLTDLSVCKLNWSSFNRLDDIQHHKTMTSGYIQRHWKDDACFGAQFLNGVNPMLIRRCTSLPKNFPVTEDMAYAHSGVHLAKEMKKGNIFLCDYKNLEGVSTNTINGKRQYLAAPLVLLHKTPDDELKPIAIQLKQTPSEDNPIFFPTDPEYDWLLAKTFVRSADFHEHELNVHLLRTHLLAEVFTVALLRNVSSVHPLYKLLIPHTRYTLHINLLARQTLISQDGFFAKHAASGEEGMFAILRRSMSSLTYSSLCLPDNITERGMECVPNYYYRDDGLRLWDIIHRFVTGILSHYYRSDKRVQEDEELQKWIQNICEHCPLPKKKGFPPSFVTMDELVKFVTMVIFMCSAQHAAVSNSQFDFGGWMPNTPTTLQLPPPTMKGRATEETLLKTLPDVNSTVNGMAILYILSKQSKDFIPLGTYPYDYFCEHASLNVISTFLDELHNLHDEIEERNKSLEHSLQYTYLDPTKVENSIAL